MIFIDLSSLSSISISASNLMNSPLVHHLIEHEIMHVFFNMMRGSRKGLSRAQRRKLANRRRRWFTDNIIMHHKRLHDRNREIVIAEAKTLAMAKKLGKAPESPTNKWRDRVGVRDRGKIIRGRVDARRSRARSRWLSVAETPESGGEDKGGFETGNVR